MNKYIFFILISIFSISCVTQKKCLQKYPPQTNTIVKDSIIIKDTIIYKDKIVEINIPGDTIEVEKIVNIKEDISPISAQNDYASASAWVKDSKLKLELIQKDQVIKLIIDSAYKEVKHWKEKWYNEKQTIVITKKYIPQIYKIALWMWIGVIIIGIGYFIISKKLL